MRSTTRQGQRAERAVVDVPATAAAVELGPYRHFMQKEIFEQPRAVADTLEGVEGIDAVAVRTARRGDPAASRIAC